MESAHTEPIPDELERCELYAAANSERLWTTFVSRDPAPARLTRLLGLLRDAPDAAPAARQGHLLMLLGRPRQAEQFLAALPDRLSVAQRALALCQVARDEALPRLYQAVVAGPQHFGEVAGPEDVAAQMRLDYARGMAHLELGEEARGREHLNTANCLALMCGNPHMEPSVTAYLLRNDQLRDPRRTVDRLVDVVREAHRLGNRVQVRDTALQARNVLLRLNAYDEIPDLVRALPDDVGAGWWAAATASLMSPGEVDPPELPTHDNDGYLTVCRAMFHLRRAVRHRNAGRLKETTAEASALLALPAWQRRLDLPHLEVLYVLARAQALALVGQPAAATRTFGGLVDAGLHLSGPLAELYTAVGLAQLLAMGATYPANVHPELLIHRGVLAFRGVSASMAQQIASRGLASGAAGVAVLAAHPDAPAALVDVVESRVAFLSESGLERTHAGPVPAYPHEQGHAVLAAQLRGDRLDEPGRQTLRRHRAVMDAGGLPMVMRAEVDRALNLLRRGVTPRE